MIEALQKAKTIHELEAAMVGMPPAEMPVIHRFVPGLYIREITIPKNTIVTSKEHRTEHVFVISSGEIMVSSENEGSVIYKAPYTGITRPGTKRALFALEDTIWTTFHVTNETDVEKIADAILKPCKNPLLDPGMDDQWKFQLPKNLP